MAQLTTVARVLRSITESSPWLGAQTINQVRIMNCLTIYVVQGYHPTQTMLSKELAMPRAAISKVLKHLMDRGIVEYRTNPDDARRREFQFTSHGQDLVKDWSASARLV